MNCRCGCATISRESETVRPVFTSARAAARRASVMRFTVPRWSSPPQRPQLFSRLKYDSTSACVGSFGAGMLASSREMAEYATACAIEASLRPCARPPRARYHVRMPQLVRTMCPMNCHPTLCGMLVEVDDGRVTRVSGDVDNPDSRGFLCVRGQAAPEILDNPRRLLYPMMRATRTDHWRRATWDEALDTITARMRAVGREAVATWSGHGVFANNYGTRIHSHLLRRFSNIWGCQWWSPAIICWALGGFGLGLTGLLEPNTKEDMGANAAMIVLWGANLASQPNTARHLAAARRRGARIVTIDVRETEASAQSDETLLIRPATDAALALAMMHVIVTENLADRDFVGRHTVGFEPLAAHVHAYTPEWAAAVTGIAATRIVDLARWYATTRPAMIVVGGSSMHKSSNGWQAARAIACLPALTGQVGIP